MKRYRYVGRTAETLDDGRPVTTGDTVEVDLSKPHNQWLVDDGRLIPLEGDEKLAGKALDDRCKELEIDGWSQMTADEKREAVAAAENDDTGDDD